MSEILKFTRVCAVIGLAIWSMSVILAYQGAQSIDPLWQIEVTVRLDAPDCARGETAAAGNEDLALRYYLACHGWAADESGACDNTSATQGASQTEGL